MFLPLSENPKPCFGETSPKQQEGNHAYSPEASGWMRDVIKFISHSHQNPMWRLTFLPLSLVLKHFLHLRWQPSRVPAASLSNFPYPVPSLRPFHSLCCLHLAIHALPCRVSVTREHPLPYHIHFKDSTLRFYSKIRNCNLEFTVPLSCQSKDRTAFPLKFYFFLSHI